MRADTRDDNEVEVQMAPLIDCVFLLLIFFLVATTLKKIEPELPLELPEAPLAATPTPVTEEQFRIAIDETGKLYLGAEAVTIGLLQDEVRRRAEEDPDQPVRLNADRRAPWASVMQVLEVLKFEGMTNVRPGAKNR